MLSTLQTYVLTQAVACLGLAAILWLGLLPVLLGGLLVYFVIEFGSRMLSRFGVLPAMGRIIFSLLIALVTIGAFAAAVISSLSLVSGGQESLVVLLQRMADVVDAGRNHLPLWAQHYLPDGLQEMQQAISDWLRQNAGHFSAFGKDVGVFLTRVIIGMIIGGMIAMHPVQLKTDRPLARAVGDRVVRLSDAFRRVAFSQIRISAINTCLTAFFLLLVLPMFGVQLPLTKTMIVVTFIVGLLPIVGNLISNTMIFVIALSVSPVVAVGSLIVLIVMHKFEYFLNAHIIGTEIKAQAWELLLAMVVMEAAFGLTGLVAAPIYYAYLKDELLSQKLI